METVNAIGRRKAAVARVFLRKGEGKITINKKEFETYVDVDFLRLKVMEPFTTLGLENEFSITVNVSGGGIKGQAEAIRLGICRALVKVNAEYKPAFKAKGMMTRDSRVVERKKPGLRKARKQAQFSKR